MPGGDCDEACAMMRKSVHKNILCTRSQYFRKAFTGSFKEAKTSEVIIDGHSALAVDNVLYYLYTEVVVDCKLTSIDSAVDLFVAADYFGVDYVKDKAASILGHRLSDLYKRPHGHDQEKQLLPPSERDSFFRAARLAYASAPTFEMMRSPLERFVLDTGFLLTQDTWFKQELKDIPEFALAIIDMMAFTPSDELPSKCSTVSCSICDTGYSEFAETWVACVKPVGCQRPNGELILRGTCSDCTNNGE
ncbi:hypothetical protein PG988_006736 [Apiospora saccharicola]